MSVPRAISVCVLAGLAVATAADERPTVSCDPALLRHSPPEVPPWDADAPYYTLYDGVEKRDELQLGVGHIRGASNFWWGGHVRLPLHAAPREEPWGWFADGWLVRTGLVPGEPEPIGLRGTVETEYEATSFLVLAEHPDGWLRIRYARPSDGDNGTAWTHLCQLNRDRLIYEHWETRFASDEISPLFFRDGRPRALSATPDDSSDEVARIDGDYHLEPLEFRGDWMRVRLKQPSDYCVEPDDVRTSEGWVRWRSTDRGPLVWYYTRGC